jgi:hypothetical protein
MPSIADQHVVVPGGASGFGFATAKAARTEGARVTIASRSAEKLRGALVRLGNRASGECVDVTDKPMLERFFAGLGPFDHLAVTVGDGLSKWVLGLVQCRPRGLSAYQQVGLDHPCLRPCRAARVARAGYLCPRAWRDRGHGEELRRRTAAGQGQRGVRRRGRHRALASIAGSREIGDIRAHRRASPGRPGRQA